MSVKRWFFIVWLGNSWGILATYETYNTLLRWYLWPPKFSDRYHCFSPLFESLANVVWLRFYEDMKYVTSRQFSSCWTTFPPHDMDSRRNFSLPVKSHVTMFQYVNFATVKRGTYLCVSWRSYHDDIGVDPILSINYTRSQYVSQNTLPYWHFCYF